MSITSPNPSRPTSSFNEVQSSNKSKILRKSTRVGDSPSGAFTNNNNNSNNNFIIASSPLLGMFSLDSEAPSLRARAIPHASSTNNSNNKTVAGSLEDYKNGHMKLPNEALFQYYAAKGNFEIMHADEQSERVIHACLAIPEENKQNKTESTNNSNNKFCVNNNNNTTFTEPASTTQAAIVTTMKESNTNNNNNNTNTINMESDKTIVSSSNENNKCEHYDISNNDNWEGIVFGVNNESAPHNSLRPPQAADVIVKVSTRKQIQEQCKSAEAQARLSTLSLPPLSSYYHNLYKGSNTTPLITEIQDGLRQEMQRVNEQVAKHRREVASHFTSFSPSSPYTTTSRLKDVNKNRLTNTGTLNSNNNNNPLPNWSPTQKTFSPTSMINYTYVNSVNNNNNNNNTFNSSISSSSIALMPIDNTTNNNNNNNNNNNSADKSSGAMSVTNPIPAPPPLTSPASARSISAQGTHHSASHEQYNQHIHTNANVHGSNSITTALGEGNKYMMLLTNTNDTCSYLDEKEFNTIVELHAKRMELIRKLEVAFAKLKAQANTMETTLNKSINSHTFTRLSLSTTANATLPINTTTPQALTSNNKNNDDDNNNNKTGKMKKSNKKRKGSKPELKPSDIPINLIYFVNALLLYCDRAGRIGLHVIERVFHSAPFEIHSGATSEAVRTLFYWVHNHSQATHDSTMVSEENINRDDTDSSGFASGANAINNSISNLRSNMHTNTPSSGSAEEKSKSIISKTNRQTSHMSSPSSSICLNRPRAMSKEMAHRVSGSFDNRNVTSMPANAFSSISANLRQQSSNIFNKGVKRAPVEQFIYLHEFIAALDVLINSKETGKIARYQCFRALVKGSSGNNYIHRAWIDKVRMEQKQMLHKNVTYKAQDTTLNKGGLNNKLIKHNMMKRESSDECNYNAWTPSLIAALNSAFNAIAQNEEAEYAKLIAKRNKKNKRQKTNTNNNSGAAATVAANVSNSKSKQGSQNGNNTTAGNKTTSSSASVKQGESNDLVIPLGVMRRCHFNFEEFDKWFDTLPMLAAALLPVWLPLLIGTVNVNNVMSSKKNSKSNLNVNNNCYNNDEEEDDDDEGAESKETSMLESSSSRLQRNKTGINPSLSFSSSRRNESAAAKASDNKNNDKKNYSDYLSDQSNAHNTDNVNNDEEINEEIGNGNNNNNNNNNATEKSFSQIRLDNANNEDKSENKNKHINKMRNSRRKLQSVCARGTSAWNSSDNDDTDDNSGIYPLTLIGDDEMSRHAFLQELINERVTCMNNSIV